MNFFLGWPIFRGYVSFREGTTLQECHSWEMFWEGWRQRISIAKKVPAISENRIGPEFVWFVGIRTVHGSEILFGFADVFSGVIARFPNHELYVVAATLNELWSPLYFNNLPLQGIFMNFSLAMLLQMVLYIGISFELYNLWPKTNNLKSHETTWNNDVT